MTEKGNFKISEISASEKTVSTLESKFLENHLKYQIVTIESGGQLYSYFVEVFTNKGSDIYPETITKLNDFTGTFNVFLLNGENLGAVAIYKGKGRDISENNNLNVLTESINAFLTKSDATHKMPQCGGNHFVFIDQTISRFDVWTVGDKIVAINYVGTTTTRTTSIMAFPCDGLYDKNDILNQRLESYNYKNGSGGGISAPTPEQIAKALQKQIDGTNLAACPKAVLEQLKNATNCDIANMLVKLGINKVYNLNIVSGIPTDGTPASTTRTNSSLKFNYTITISTDYNDATSLFRASNILHEVVHSFFMSLKDDQITGGGLAAYGEFPILFQAYCDSKYPPNKNEAANAHHEEMANQYVNAIASSLQEYNSSNDPNGLVPYQVYSDLAWGGLSGTPIFKEHFKGRETEITRILNRYACEQSGRSVESGTPNVQNPIGKPCNK